MNNLGDSRYALFYMREEIEILSKLLFLKRNANVNMNQLGHMNGY